MEPTTFRVTIAMDFEAKKLTMSLQSELTGLYVFPARNTDTQHMYTNSRAPYYFWVWFFQFIMLFVFTVVLFFQFGVAQTDFCFVCQFCLHSSPVLIFQSLSSLVEILF